jgi:hypothetical protein
VNQHVLIAGGVAGALGLAFVLGRWTAPRPAVHAIESEHRTEAQAAAEDRAAVYGPLDAHIVVGGCATPGQAPQPNEAPRVRQRPPQTLPEALADLPPGSVVDLHQDSSMEQTHTVEAQASTEDRHLDLTVKPQDAPGWAAQVGIEDALGARPVRLALRRRLFGPFWVEVSGIPSRQQLGVAGAVEW